MYKPKNEFLATYLEYVEDTESPRIFHLWVAITGISACLGRRSFLPFGIGPVFPNIYSLLVGPPGTRKSTAINIMARRIRKNTGVKFAPEDTAGQRQGLIAALKGGIKDEDDEINGVLSAADAASAIKLIETMEHKIDARDEHVMFAAASEFDSFIGTRAREFAAFLGKMWDGEDYDYTLKNEKHVLTHPLLTIIGGTTPANIQDSLPQSSIGQGFTSRIIFVYANRKYKDISRPKELPRGLEKKIDKVFNELFYYFDGEFKETQEARKLLDDIYHRETEISDPRFVYYCERRHQHLLKTSMCLAAARKSLIIEIDDIKEADLILKITEEYMPDALGEFGLSQISAAKQKMLEFLMHANGPVVSNILWAVMQKDLRQSDFHNSIADLINAGKITQVKTNEGPAFVYNDVRNPFDMENGLWKEIEADIVGD